MARSLESLCDDSHALVAKLVVAEIVRGYPMVLHHEKLSQDPRRVLSEGAMRKH